VIEVMTTTGASTPAHDRMPFVVDLADIRTEELAVAGGKAANLGRLLRAGFAVPPGFVITTAAYDAVIAANALRDAMHGASERDGPAEIRAGFERAAIPPQVERAIRAAYRRLGGGAVAVRSSATAEDLPEAAFAGQQETFLGINDEAALLEAVRGCWASLWGERAVAYRAHHGMANVPVKLAVVVQRMVRAEAAGVLFTANPITGARDETVIEAVAGLGEALVSGEATPDQFVLRNTRHRWRIVERHPGRRDPRSAPVLPDGVLRQLARVGASIVRLFGQPQDIEWAWADGRLFVLQSRPITALPDPPPRRRFEPPRFAADYLQIRPYPLDVTTWMAAVMRALPRMLPLDGLIPALDAMLVADDGVVERYADWPGFRFSPRLLLAPVRFAALARQHDPADWRDDPVWIAYVERNRKLEATALRALSWNELLAIVREALTLPSMLMEVRRRYFPRGALALGALRLFLAPLGLTDRFADLLAGVDNSTLQANRALEALAAEVRAAPDLKQAFADHDATALRGALAASEAGRAFLEQFDAFFAAYGHRETGSPLLVSQPTWKDAPETVFAILQGLARAEPPRRQALETWRVARDDALAHPALRTRPMRAAFLTLLTEARRLSALREDTHYAMTMPMPVVRRSLLEMGRRLAGIGVLASPEDVFHLRFDELERIGDAWPPPAALADDLKGAAQRRAARRATLASTPLMDLAGGGHIQPGGDVLAVGMPGSPGLIEGPVRVVPDVAAFGSLLPGEVLVAPYTNPSWTPLFGRAAAVVVDTGAAMSHASIVAREYGLPAVMGTGDATRRLRDGQWVRVDGSRGLVFAATPGRDERSAGVEDRHVKPDRTSPHSD
jgi:pyruvate,water dikinase